MAHVTSDQSVSSAAAAVKSARLAPSTRSYRMPAAATKSTSPMPNPSTRPARPAPNSKAVFVNAASLCALLRAPRSTTCARYAAMSQARDSVVLPPIVGGDPGSIRPAGIVPPLNPAKHEAALSSHPGTASQVAPLSVEYFSPQPAVKRTCVAGPGGPSGPTAPLIPRG